QALRRRSPLLFYAVSTVLMWWLAMGPAPDDAPMQAFVRPYTWLTVLPGFSGLRAPSRFAMLACLSLSIAAALAVRRVAAKRSASIAGLGGIVVLGLLLDGWTVPIPLAAPAGRFVLPDVKDSAVLEIPADDSLVNTSAMYRAIRHGRPLINGYSGHTPPHYRILQSALRREDPTVLEFFARDRPLIIVINGRSDVHGTMQRFVRSLPDVQEHGGSSAGSIFVIPARPRERLGATGQRIEPAGVRTDAGEHAVIDLGRPRIVRAIGFPLRWHYEEMAVRLDVTISDDGVTWSPAWEGWTAALALAGALEDQKSAPIRIPLPDINTRYVRIHPAPNWMVREVSVYAPRDPIGHGR
ncbi:MAG: discoidin domain-containing protein, partial [Acidobacteria bacterium]|nr:discoidin domain-containing protein [Acidobacteriota bacterium]